MNTRSVKILQLLSSGKLMFAALIALVGLCSGCDQKLPADLIVMNARIYTVDSAFSTVEAFAVKDGRFIETGSKEAILKKYESVEVIDLQGKVVVPGLIDAHCHFYGLGQNAQRADLVGSNSVADILQRLRLFYETNKPDVIRGRGWDQNDWELKEFPDRHVLDSVFPDIPVVLERIDGHAYWVNTRVLEMAGITSETSEEGGAVVKKDGSPTGILVDKPMELVDRVLPADSEQAIERALKDAQDICFANGLTTVSDAGLSRSLIEFIGRLQDEGELKIRVYAMVSNTPEDLDYYLEQGKISKPLLNVRSVKVYADGALGSRGAALKAPYSDAPGHFGAMITPASEIENLAVKIAKAGFQMNTHAIGDSANIAVLRSYKKVLEQMEDPRWRVEHAQIVSAEDQDLFSTKILPSVQPTHATSDMYWAEDRLGSERIKGAYAYKSLLEQSGLVALGTDFPVEQVSPFLTFYAAVARKDLKGYPEEGFYPVQALSREETLRGMTIWAAYANFEEKDKGSIEPGKFADFTVMDRDLMEVEETEIPSTRVLHTFVNGKQVFSAQP